MTKEKKLKALELICDLAIGFTTAAIADSVGEGKGVVTKTILTVGTLAIGVAASVRLNEGFAMLRNKDSAENA
jgi:hypothetical protein